MGLQYGKGDEIVVTELDHHANVAPWRAACVERGVQVKNRQDGSRNGPTGLGQDFRAIDTTHDKAGRNRRGFECARNNQRHSHARSKWRDSVGALVFVDAVHYAPHALVDVQALDCDFLRMSAYKFYGPHVGVLFGKMALLESINFPKLIPAPDAAPEKVETGTQNQEGMVGAGAAVDFLASLAEWIVATRAVGGSLRWVASSEVGS